MPPRLDIPIRLNRLPDDAALAYLAFTHALGSFPCNVIGNERSKHTKLSLNYFWRDTLFIPHGKKMPAQFFAIVASLTPDSLKPALPRATELREEICRVLREIVKVIDVSDKPSAWETAQEVLSQAREDERQGKKKYLSLRANHDNGEGKVAIELPQYRIKDGRNMDAKKLQDLLSKLQKAQDAQKKTAEAVAEAEAEAAKIVQAAKDKAAAQDELVTSIGKEIAAEMGDLLPKPAKAAKAAKEGGKRTRRSKADVEAALATLEKAILHVLKGSKEPLSREALLSKASTAPVSQADWTKVKDKLLKAKLIDSSGEKAATVYTIA